MNIKKANYSRKKKYRYHRLLALLLFVAAVGQFWRMNSFDLKWDVLNNVLHIDRNLIYILVLAVAVWLLFAILKKKIPRWNRRKQYRAARMFEIDRMAGKEFEAFLSIYFADLGYKVLREIGGSGDLGGDILLRSPDGEKVVVQAKRYSGKVPFRAIQEVHTAQSLYGAQRAIIITNNYFTRQTKESAQRLNIELWDRNKLIENMYAYRKGKKGGVRHGQEKTMGG